MSRSARTEPYALRAARRAAPAIRVRPGRARRDHLHPATPNDVNRLLALVGPSGTYGLRAVELRQRPGGHTPHVLVATLRMPGVVVLYEQPCPPWLLAGRLTTRSGERLRRAGARITLGGAWTEVAWPGETLRDFVLFDGLLHEIGHHVVQHSAGGSAGRRSARVMRTLDHERRAEAFVERYRRAWGPA